MKNYDQSVKINHNSNCHYVPDHLYRILIIGGSGSGKTNALLNLIKGQGPDIDKIYLHFKDPLESKYQLHINEKEKVEIEILKNPKAFIDYSKISGGVYGNFEHYNPTRERRVSIVFDDMIADMGCNKKLSPIVTELFLRRRKPNILLGFVSQSYFKVGKTIGLSATHYFIMKTLNNWAHPQIASNHLSDTDFKDFMKLYKNYTTEPYSVLVNDTTFSSNNSLQFRKDLL